MPDPPNPTDNTTPADTHENPSDTSSKPDNNPTAETNTKENPTEPSPSDAAQLANAVAVAIKDSTATENTDKPTSPSSSSSSGGEQAPGKSRGRGGDRPAANTPAAQQSHVIDPTNPYLVVHPSGAHTYPAFHPGMPGPHVHPGFPPGMVHHNPYMMFPPMMHGRPGHMMQVPILPPHLDMSQYQQGTAPTANGTTPAAGTAAAEGSATNAEGGTEAATTGEGGATPATTPATHPGPYPPGFPQLAHAFHPPTDQNGQPLPYHHLLPTLHPHGPPGTAIQLTLPLAVADHTLPSHLDVLIRAPDSLNITYSEVPEGAYLLRTDFGDIYPKNLEPPRKTTEMRCLFCKRHYSGPNARGMWRRHVTGKHDFMFERKGKDGSGGRRAPLMPGMIGKEDDLDGDMSMSFREGDDVLNGAQKMDGEDDEGHGEGSRSKEQGQPDGSEPQQVLPGGMTPGDMSMVSLNGMPIHTMGMHMAGYPAGHPPQMQISMQMHMLGNPPHPMMVPAAPPERRKAKPRGSGVGMGNGGGGLVPRVHPLLTKEERIERARASKRHYAMKRRAMEKMKAGGIPKGARLVDGVFILADGTQIPAEPGRVYTDLSTHHASSSKREVTTADAEDDDDNEPPSKRRKRVTKKRDEPEIDPKDDEEDEQGIDAALGDVTMVTADEEDDAEQLVSIDNWNENPAVYQATNIPVPVNQTPINPQTGLPWTKLADVPYVNRAFKPPSTAVEVKMPTSSAPPVPPAAQPEPVVVVEPTQPPAEEPQQPPAPPADANPEPAPEPEVAQPPDSSSKRRRGRPASTAKEPPAPPTKTPKKRVSKRQAAKQAAQKEDEEDEIDEDEEDEAQEPAPQTAAATTSVTQAGGEEPGEGGTAVESAVTETPAEPEPATVREPPTRRMSTRERAPPRRVSVRGKAAAAAAAASEAAEGPSSEPTEAVAPTNGGPSGLISSRTRRGGPDTSKGTDRTFCYCEDHEYGNMIGCDNRTCPREWFHLACTDIQGPIPSTWYCKDCRGASADVPRDDLPIAEAQDSPAEPETNKAKTRSAGDARGRGRGKGRGRGRGRGGANAAARQEPEPESAPASKEAPTKPSSTRSGKGKRGGKGGRGAKDKSALPNDPESEDDVYESEDQAGGGATEAAAPETGHSLNVDEDYDEAEETTTTTKQGNNLSGKSQGEVAAS